MSPALPRRSFLAALGLAPLGAALTSLFGRAKAESTTVSPALPGEVDADDFFEWPSLSAPDRDVLVARLRAPGWAELDRQTLGRVSDGDLEDAALASFVIWNAPEPPRCGPCGTPYKKIGKRWWQSCHCPPPRYALEEIP